MPLHPREQILTHGRARPLTCHGPVTRDRHCLVPFPKGCYRSIGNPKAINHYCSRYYRTPRSPLSYPLPRHWPSSQKGVPVPTLCHVRSAESDTIKPRTVSLPPRVLGCGSPLTLGHQHQEDDQMLPSSSTFGCGYSMIHQAQFQLLDGELPFQCLPGLDAQVAYPSPHYSHSELVGYSHESLLPLGSPT